MVGYDGIVYSPFNQLVRVFRNLLSSTSHTHFYQLTTIRSFDVVLCCKFFLEVEHKPNVFVEIHATPVWDLLEIRCFLVDQMLFREKQRNRVQGRVEHTSLAKCFLGSLSSHC